MFFLFIARFALNYVNKVSFAPTDILISHD